MVSTRNGIAFGNGCWRSCDSFFYQGNGIRKGKWKYLRAKHRVPGYVQDKQRAEVEELYDLEADLGETRNLASSQPEKVEELKRLMLEVQQKDQLEEGIAFALMDDFQSSEHPLRQALRGDWKFDKRVASCVADPKLYEEFKNHGSI